MQTLQESRQETGKSLGRFGNFEAMALTPDRLDAGPPSGSPAAGSGAPENVRAAPFGIGEGEIGGQKREALGSEASGADKKLKVAEGDDVGTVAERPPIPADAMVPLGGTPFPSGEPVVTSTGTNRESLPPRQQQQQQQGAGDKPMIAPGVVQ